MYSIIQGRAQSALSEQPVQSAELPRLCSESFPSRDLQISPPKAFAAKIHKKFGLTLKDIYWDYNFPKAASPQQVESWVLQDKLRTNVGVTLHSRFVKGLFDGIYRYVSFRPPPQNGEAYIAQKQILKTYTDELFALNHGCFANIDTNELNIDQLYNIIWGCASSIAPRDIISFTIKSDRQVLAKNRHLSRALLQEELEEQGGVKLGWTASYETLNSIQQAFENSPYVIKPGILSKLRSSSLKLLNLL